MYTKLLKRQLRRHLPENYTLSEEIQNLLNAINRSYEHYERDHVLGKHSLDISSAELHQLADELEEKEKFVSAILDSAAVGIVAANEQNLIEVCNPLAAQYLGLEKSELLIGKKITDFINLVDTRGMHELTIKGYNNTDYTIELYVSEVILQMKKLLIYVLNDITAHKEAEAKMREAQKKEKELQNLMIDAARQAGMMQVASSVLHNVGNVLTTINISAAVLKVLTVESELKTLSKIAMLLEEHKDDLGSYLKEDPKGKHLPDFLIALAQQWKDENAQVLSELENLEKNIYQIKKIIKIQQSLTPAIGVQEIVSINAILNDLLAMYANELKNNNISVIKEFGEIPEISLDRGKLIQILVNLMRNGIEALILKNSGKREFRIRTLLKEPHLLQIDVMDTGPGIEKMYLVKIFSYGFTTKENGHGIGLHMSAILAQEMGGTLSAASNGLNTGATFTLILPLQANEQ